MKISLGDDQSIERGEPDNDTPGESVVWLSLRCEVDGSFHGCVALSPATARELFGALRQFDNAGLLEDEL